MSFNVKKWQHMTITNKRKIITANPKYHTMNEEIKTVNDTQSPYLGVTITDKLSWKKHVSRTAARTNKTLQFIQRDLKPCLPSTKERET